MVETTSLDDPSWHAFVAGAPGATCFHRPEWASLLADCYRYRAFALVRRDGSGQVVAGLPVVEVRGPTGGRRWLSLPFSDECAPLTAPGANPADLDGLLRDADALRRERGVGDLVVRADLGLGDVPAQQVAVTHTLTLDEAGGRRRSSVRRAVAAAARNGITVRPGTSAPDAEQFYRLHLLTRRRQGVPVQPRRYVRMLWERLLEPGHGRLLLAEKDGEVLAAAVYLTGGSTVTYKYGASDERAWPLRPNHAVMATAIAWAGEQGYASFDFGRSDLDNPGLARFKESWGAVARPLRYTSFAASSAPAGSPAAAGRARALLAPVIRRSPPVVCRGLGELLYRYAA